MEKKHGKIHHPRLCLLVALSAFFWLCLLYFDFMAIGNGNAKSFNTLPVDSNPNRVITNNAIHTPQQEKPMYTFVRALRTAENKSDPCGGRYIYVHALSSRFNEDMLKECSSLSLWTDMCKFTTNAGLGPPLGNAERVFSRTGWYETNQFAVDVIFTNQMKQYECLTNDSSLAAAIFVPFYAGFDIARYLWGHNISTRDASSLALDFRRLSDRESDWGNKLLLLPAAKNMSMLVVESNPWNANDYGIPYPTYFHPAKDEDVIVWQERMRRLAPKYLAVISLVPRLIYADPRAKMKTFRDAFDVAVSAVVEKVAKLRKDMVEGRRDDGFVEELGWKYDLLDEGEVIGPHEWDPYFSKPK
ncbi:hypothetical protein SASPL_137786 [Salvia splendens]|uniref:Exostosin GT47 domain-containing protein n=1 Tax=Salvia splendens TaxID=180675 RepID=A0A8X8WU03_SALSN|nr:hypothetical protein SASPL_137786 [Salvia splendens]